MRMIHTYGMLIMGKIFSENNNSHTHKNTFWVSDLSANQTRYCEGTQLITSLSRFSHGS